MFSSGKGAPLFLFVPNAKQIKSMNDEQKRGGHSTASESKQAHEYTTSKKGGALC